MPRISLRNHGSILQELKISLFDQPTHSACATCRMRFGVGVPNAARIAFLSSPRPSLDLDLVEPGQAGLEPAQRLLQALLEGAADRHHFADRLHPGHGGGAGKFLEREAGNLGDT